MNNSSMLANDLIFLDLSPEEAAVYTELLKAPTTHLALSRATGINRTKVYRVVQDLEHRGLVARQTDDRGTFLVAHDPSVLESSLIAKEQKLMEQRATLHRILPSLSALQSEDNSLFTVRTYDGLEGLKQMCWHELKAQDELLSFGSGTIEDMIPSHYWAEKHRALSVGAHYKVYEIINDTKNDHVTFTGNVEYMRRFHYRILPLKVLKLENQTIIYNDTVAIYHWREDQKCGVEIISRSYAQMMRRIFWHYWRISAEPVMNV